MQEPRQIEVNTYNLNDRKFGYRDDDLNTSQTDYNNNNNSASYYGGPAARAANPPTYINEYARQDYDDEPHEPIQINNPIYYQQQPQQQQPPQQPQRQYSGSRGPTPPTPTRRVTPPPQLSSQPVSQLPTVAEAGVREQRENEAANRQLYRGDDDDDADDDDPDVRMRDQRSQQEFYFNTQVRNTGYWGKVRLRRGTWMVIVGLFFMCVSLTIISVRHFRKLIAFLF